MDVVENIVRYVEKQKLQIRQMNYFSPLDANFNCPYLKIDLCDLSPVLLEFITFSIQKNESVLIPVV